jgi:predicted flap endonuclease-1-like 5' DNA nuclease
MTYRQVALQQVIPGGFRQDVAWIDADLAMKGRLVRDDDGEIWTVAEVYGARPADVVHAWYTVHKQFRDVLEDH